MKCATRAYKILALLGAEIGAWILAALEEFYWPLPQACGDAAASVGEPIVANERLRLQSLLRFHESVIPGLFSPALDPALLLVPRFAVDKITDDLLALNEGEVRPMFQASKKNKHGKRAGIALLWKQRRQRALEHVAFLTGQGIGKGKARDRVCTAIEVNTETIRTWERDERKQMLPGFNLELAKRAGELAVNSR